MSDRITKGHVERVFAAVAKAYGRSTDPWGEYKKTRKATVGAWSLDYNPHYGGWVIEEIHSEAGGVTTPFGDRRLSTSQFYQALWMVLRALQIKGCACR